MKTLSFILLSLCLLVACNEKQESIVKPEDIAAYMQTNIVYEGLVRCNANIDFWQSRTSGTTEMSKLSGLYASRFKLTGSINDLHRSDSLLTVVDEKQNGQVGIYHAMATNAISQHQFKKAKEYITRALAIGEKKSASLLMLADVSLELGDTFTANVILNDFKNKNAFAWLVRKAKVKDHEGQLDSTIYFMERALKRAGGSNDLYIWTKTNLGDFYSHAGRINEAYNCYLDILKKDPECHYALKQIAWIAFSNDHNTGLAKEILLHLSDIDKVPDHFLTLAQVASWEGNHEQAAQYMEKFTSMTSDVRYGDMYNKYLINAYTSDIKNPEEALRLAKREVANRPTTQSYDLLAWAYLHSGNKSEALAIVNERVLGKTFEPDAIYHMGIIYKEHGLHLKSSDLLHEAMISTFELGPLVTRDIQKSLASKAI